MANPDLEGLRVGFLGCGAMARALAGGLVESGVPASQILGSDPFEGAREHFTESIGAESTTDNARVVSESDVVILAVKPGAVAGLLAALDAAICEKPLWISIAAGVPLSHLQDALPAGARVVRTMPNTPALVGAGSTAWYPAPTVGQEDAVRVEAVLNAAGWCWRAPNEDLLDAVTGLSGSGPAYVFLILEALGDAGVRQGLPRDAAQELAVRTVLGSAKLALETGQHPGVLKDQVTSPGGTTIAGLERLETGGVRAALYEAVAAATQRSKDLKNG